MWPHSILIADDHEVVRRGVRALLEGQPGLKIVGEAVSGRDAVAKAAELRPEIIVLDIGMPDLNGLVVARQIRKTVPTSQILVLTMHESHETVREVLLAGARGYLLKSDAGRDLVDAVQALLDGRIYFTSKVGEMVLQEYRTSLKQVESKVGESTITAREREIVKLVVDGKSSKEIGALLSLSPKTIESHRTNIMRKLNVHSVGELVRWAIRRKVVEA